MAAQAPRRIPVRLDLVLLTLAFFHFQSSPVLSAKSATRNCAVAVQLAGSPQTPTEIQRIALRALAGCPSNTRVWSILQGALLGGEEQTRRVALRSLRPHLSPAARQVLMRLLSEQALSPPDRTLTIELLAHLEGSADGQLGELLVHELRSSAGIQDPTWQRELQVAVLHALANIRFSPAEALVTELARSGQTGVRAASLAYLASLPQSSERADLLELAEAALRDADPGVRAQAQQLLVVINSPASREALAAQMPVPPSNPKRPADNGKAGTSPGTGRLRVRERLRAEAHGQASILMVLGRGTVLHTDGKSIATAQNEWLRVTSNEVTGWLPRSSVEILGVH